MRWLYHPLLLLIARSSESELIKQLEFLKAENQMLRRRLPKNIRPTAVEWALLIQLGRAVGNAGVRALISIVSYSSWVRRLRMDRERVGEPIAAPRRNGRPRTPEHVRELILRMARENSGWGYTRILGELRKLRIKTSRSNVVNILRTHGHDPKTDPTKGTWAEFLRAHAETLWQCDFFWKYASGPDGILRKCMALTFVHVASRRVWVSPCTFHPTQVWVLQQAKSFIDHKTGVGAPLPLVMRDNDQLYGRIDETLKAGGARVHHLAFRSPNTNAYVERFVQSIKQECLDHFALCGPDHMDHLIREYLEYYHHERPHQSKGNEPLLHAVHETPAEGEVLCRERLGGLLRHYYREAAA